MVEGHISHRPAARVKESPDISSSIFITWHTSTADLVSSPCPRHHTSSQPMCMHWRAPRVRFSSCSSTTCKVKASLLV